MGVLNVRRYILADTTTDVIGNSDVVVNNIIDMDGCSYIVLTGEDEDITSLLSSYKVHEVDEQFVLERLFNNKYSSVMKNNSISEIKSTLNDLIVVMADLLGGALEEWLILNWE